MLCSRTPMNELEQPTPHQNPENGDDADQGRDPVQAGDSNASLRATSTQEAPAGDSRTATPPLAWRRGVGTSIGVLIVGSLWALAIVVQIRGPATLGPVPRGARLAGNLGCFACHGPGGAISSPNLGTKGEGIPDWIHGNHNIADVNDIRMYILNGRPDEIPQDAPWDPARDGATIRMPAYRSWVTDSDLEDLVAYHQAVTGFNPGMPRPAFLGRRLAAEKGCFSCHGASGRDRIANPGSFKGYIPEWDGPDFEELVHDDGELQSWILKGMIPRIQDNPIARHFLDCQLIKMPAYEGQIEEPELEAIVAYIKHLRNAS